MKNPPHFRYGAPPSLGKTLQNSYDIQSYNMYGSLFRRNETSKFLDAATLPLDGHDFQEGSTADRKSAAHESKITPTASRTTSSPLVPHTTSSEAAGTIWSGFMNLTNTIVGAGMLGLPGAFAGTGIAGGSILILLGAFFSAHGLILLSKAAQRTGLPASFYSAARATVPQYTVLIDLAVALKCFGVATGYLITVGDCMVDAMRHILLNGQQEDDNRRWIQVVLSRQFWVVGAVIGVMPFSFFRHLDDLKKTSALALIFVFFLAVGIIVYANDIADACPEDLQDCRGEIVAFTDFPTTLSKLPIFIFAFTCHQNIFPIVNELHNRTQERLNWIIILSIGFSLLLFYVVAVEGYRTFGSNVKGDILVNYPTNGYVTSLRISIAFMLALHFPLQLDPSRRCISSLIATIKRWHDDIGEHYCKRPMSDLENHGSSDSSEVTPFEKEDGRALLQDDYVFRVVTVSFLFLSFSVAMLVDDLGVVLAAVGSTGSTLVTYILPGLIYLNLRSSGAGGFTKFMACVQLGLGCFIMPIALYYLILGKTTTH